jgi:hypothetical protein
MALALACPPLGLAPVVLALVTEVLHSVIDCFGQQHCRRHLVSWRGGNPVHGSGGPTDHADRPSEPLRGRARLWPIWAPPAPETGASS